MHRAKVLPQTTSFSEETYSAVSLETFTTHSSSIFLRKLKRSIREGEKFPLLLNCMFSFRRHVVNIYEEIDLGPDSLGNRAPF